MTNSHQLPPNHINPKYDPDRNSLIDHADLENILAAQHHTKFTEALIASLNQTQMEATEPPAQLSAYPLLHGTDLDAPVSAHHAKTTSGDIDHALITNVLSGQHHTKTASGDIDHALITNVLSTQHHDPALQDVDKVDGCDAVDIVDPLTVTKFKANAGTGTATTPNYINDGNGTGSTEFNAVDEYAEVNWGNTRSVVEFRWIGISGVNGDGLYKIQYNDEGTWVDVHTGINQRNDTWSSWIPLNTSYIGSSVRIVATALDTGTGGSQIHEWEMRG